MSTRAASDTPKTTTPRRIARYYRGARTTHLERLATFVPGDFLYYKPMYDFDDELASSMPFVRKVSFRHVFMSVLRAEYEVLELAEPYTPSALPQNLALALASNLSRLSGRVPTKFVTYAIENADLSEKIATRLRVPVSLIRPVTSGLVGFSFARLNRIVFGTLDARENYRSLLSDRQWNRKSLEHTLIWGLPSPSTLQLEAAPNPQLVFLGALDDRKGVVQLLAIWDSVKESMPDARLLILGKGPRSAEVARWAESRRDVEVILDPSRQEISAQLILSTALFLFSQPSALWKEQIGLPILEALEVGLEVIASTETGIAQWLETNGHAVIAPSASEAALVAAVVGALSRPRRRADVLGSLPRVDGRLAADQWLFRPGA